MSAEVSYVVAKLQRLSGPLWCELIISCVMMNDTGRLPWRPRFSNLRRHQGWSIRAHLKLHSSLLVAHAVLVGFVTWVAVGYYWMPIPPGEDIIVSVYSFWLKVQDASGSQSQSDANSR